MKKQLLLGLVVVMITAVSCKNSEPKKETMSKHENLLLKPFDTEYGVPPFDKILISDYMPAYEKALSEKRADIEAIVSDTSAPTFKNTIEALEYSGSLLTQIEPVFENLLSSNTNEEMDSLAEIINPLVTALYDEINMNDKLFLRVKSVYENAAKFDLNQEQKMLLTQTYKSFVRGGSNLTQENKEKLKEINKKIGLLSLKFGSNTLKSTNNFEIVIDKKSDLAGLPDNVISAAADLAKAKYGEGKWLFTIQKSSMIPVLTYSENRALREKIFKGYTTRGDHNDSLDNKANVVELVNLRLEKAQLLGFPNFASYMLDENMAKTPENANKELLEVLQKSNKKAKEELVDLQKLANKDNIKIEPWDWWFYTEKVRKEKYNFSENDLLPYFKLENVRDGMFDVANKLYNLTFKKTTKLPLMYPSAESYEVYKSDKLIAILYLDYFPRASKSGGAWMNAYRKQSRDLKGNNIIPIISLTCNFTPPNGDIPSLLNLDEATTLFHEFGHSLHGMLSNCQYNSLSGTAVPRDFVEMPSQLMENWAVEPIVLKSYAKNYKTGEPIPDSLIAKMTKASTFNNGFVVSEFASAAALDMYWHTITTPFHGDVNAFEKQVLNKVGLIDQIVVRYRSTYFNHIFAGGYEAGYYSYLWTAILDADVFGAFQETSLFDAKTAHSFETNILSKGGTMDAEQMWLNFRGREQKIDFYLKRKGL